MNKMENMFERQNLIIVKIRHELMLKKNIQQSHRFFVWFLPEVGCFMYNDQLVEYEVIKPLIDDNTLIYKGLGRYGGDLIPKYTLSEYELSNNY